MQTENKVAVQPQSVAPAAEFPRFAWLEITGKCQLNCGHCYAESGPQGTHGQMALADWLGVIGQLAAGGTRDVQFIGGEPTLHPDFSRMVRYALDCGLQVEVFSNLAFNIAPALWEVFKLPGVRLATSYYSTSTVEHDSITKGRGSHGRTLKAIAAAVERGVPLRVGVVQVEDAQQAANAIAQLQNLGVPRDRIRYDRLRGVGRGVQQGVGSGISELCGRCTSGVIAISASGHVWPCVFARTMAVGNVLESPLGAILASSECAAVTATLDQEFRTRPSATTVDPCMPMEGCVPDHKPVEPACQPRVPV